MIERHERRVVVGLVAVAVAIRVGFALTLPPLQSPDERAHFDYVQHLAAHRTLPVQPELTPAEAFEGWPQSYQPPLAYLTFVPVAAATRAWDAGPGQRLRALRLQNAIYGGLLVAIVFGIARRLRPPGHPLRLLAPLFVACLPGLAGNAGSLNNDTLANLLAAGLWWVWLALAPGLRRSLAIGVLFGAACLTKLTAATLAPLLLVVPWLQRRSLRGALAEGCLAAALALLLMLPWMLRNLALYGDPLAVGAGSFAFETLTGVLPPDLIEQARQPAPGKALLQLFGRFGVANNLSWTPVPSVWLPLAALGLAGWLRPRSTGGSADDFTTWAVGFTLAALLTGAGLVAFSLGYYGAWQGRYLFVCITPIALLLCEGGARWLPRGRTALAIALLAVLLIALDVALIWQLDGFFADTPARLWGQRTSL